MSLIGIIVIVHCINITLLVNLTITILTAAVGIWILYQSKIFIIEFRHQNSPILKKWKQKISLIYWDLEVWSLPSLKNSKNSENSDVNLSNISENYIENWKEKSQNYHSKSFTSVHIEKFVIQKQTYNILKVPEVRTIAPNQEEILYLRGDKFEIEEKHENEDFKYMSRGVILMWKCTGFFTLLALFVFIYWYYNN